MRRTCEAEWEWDVEFGVSCDLTLGHTTDHSGTSTGNGGVIALISWPNTPPTPTDHPKDGA